MRSTPRYRLAGGESGKPIDQETSLIGTIPLTRATKEDEGRFGRGH